MTINGTAIKEHTFIAANDLSYVDALGLISDQLKRAGAPITDAMSSPYSWFKLMLV